MTQKATPTIKIRLVSWYLTEPEKKKHNYYVEWKKKLCWADNAEFARGPVFNTVWFVWVCRFRLYTDNMGCVYIQDTVSLVVVDFSSRRNKCGTLNGKQQF
ncbi:hypothetical protein CW304_17575 [Bacillus sp. UFRGS-B20]|nr:hypothetical protein CW304_17575 [Bacillus sp. UFRGS-B20]